MASVQFGLTLPNRGVLFGIETLDEMIALGIQAEESGLFQSLWVGDSILAKRRPESVVLLSALAARTRKVRLAVGCMASFTIRHPVLLATQWSTLDILAGPDRLILAACLGGRYGGGDWQAENQAFGVKQSERVGRLVEGIQIVRQLLREERVSFEGKYYSLTDVTLEPRPVTRPHPPIWIAANPRPANGDVIPIRRSLRRVARLADGWMTTWLTPADFASRWQEIQRNLEEENRDPTTFDNTLYYNVNINEDREAAADESKRFLDTYYGFDITRPALDVWVAYGSPQEVIEKLQAFVAAGAKEITVRLTSWDQQGQYERFINEVIPAFV